MQIRTTPPPKVITNLVSRNDFPVLRQHPELVYLDSAATTQPPQVVIDAMRSFYEQGYASVHRGIYDLAAEATQAYESARQRISEFIGATSAHEIIFTPNATGALNLTTHLVRSQLTAGDEIVLSVAEHHSNLLPWQRLARETGAKLVWLELDETGGFSQNELERRLTNRTKIVTIAQISNVLGGSVVPLRAVAEAAHRVNARLVIDAAQSAGRLPIDVTADDVDYGAFSGHKMYGPMGVGVLYAKEEHLTNIEPAVVGGGTIKAVSRSGAFWHDIPWRYEAGTPNVAGVVGLAAAVAWLEQLGLDRVWQHGQHLTQYALERLSEVSGLQLYGPSSLKDRAGILSFDLMVQGKRLHSHDLAQVANHYGVAVRGGHHCAQVLLSTLGVTDLTRASFGVYTTTADIDRLILTLHQATSLFSHG